MKLFFSVSAALFFVLAALSETEFATNIFGAFKIDIKGKFTINLSILIKLGKYQNHSLWLDEVETVEKNQE